MNGIVRCKGLKIGQPPPMTGIAENDTDAWERGMLWLILNHPFVVSGLSLTHNAPYAEVGPPGARCNPSR
jgi:hypothetical protein